MGLIIIIECRPPKETKLRMERVAFYYSGDGTDCERALKNYCTRFAGLCGFPRDIASAIVSDNLPDNLLNPVNYDKNRGMWTDYFGSRQISYWSNRADYNPYQGRRRAQPNIFRVVGI